MKRKFNSKKEDDMERRINFFDKKLKLIFFGIILAMLSMTIYM